MTRRRHRPRAARRTSAPLTGILAIALLVSFLHQIHVASRVFEGSAFFALRHATDAGVLLKSGAATGALDPRTEWWRLFTSLFVHAGLFHLALNIVALVSVGDILEGMYGAPALLLSFFAGGAAAGIAAMALPDAGHAGIYVGASGSIFAMAGTLLVALRRLRRTEEARWSETLSSRLSGCVLLNLVLGLVVTTTASWSGMSFVIANSAHAGGLIGGAIIGLVPFRARETETTRRIRRMFTAPESSASPPDAIDV